MCVSRLFTIRMHMKATRVFLLAAALRVLLVSIAIPLKLGETSSQEEMAEETTNVPVNYEHSADPELSPTPRTLSEVDRIAIIHRVVQSLPAGRERQQAPAVHQKVGSVQ